MGNNMDSCFILPYNQENILEGALHSKCRKSSCNLHLSWFAEFPCMISKFDFYLRIDELGWVVVIVVVV